MDQAGRAILERLIQSKTTGGRKESDQSEPWKDKPALIAERLTQGKYRRYPHIEYLSDEITQAITKGGARLIVSIPPRHGKSWLISRWTPVWYLSHNPEHNIILASYEAGFAATWGRYVRNTIQEFGTELGVQISGDSQASDRWHTTAGGGMITAGVGGPITGRGGNLIIVDDPVKNFEEASSATYRQRTIDWWTSTLYTRAEPGASIVVLMTRWHERDLAGYLLSSENEMHEQWHEIRLPALAELGDTLGRNPGQALCPERYDEKALAAIRPSIGSRMWNALYQQRPTAQEGNIIHRDWIKFYDTLPSTPDETILSVDATFTGKSNSDFVSMQVWSRCKAQKFLRDRVHARLGITETIDALLELCRKHPYATLKLIENKANGPAIEDLLKRSVSGIVLWEPKGDKVSRANAVAPQFEAGNVFVPSPALNPWVKEMIEEVVSFPNAAHDDDVDAMTMALLRLEENVSRNVGTVRIVRGSA